MLSSDERLQHLHLEYLPESLIFLGYRGSIAHGTHLPPDDPNSIDDVDLIGVFLGPEDHYLGMKQCKQTVEIKHDEYDVVCYELRHFIKLLLQQNPNVLSTLYLPDEHIVLKTKHWRRILAHTSAFASKKAYNSFVGYARQQVKRMTRVGEEASYREVERMKEEIGHRLTLTEAVAQSPILHDDYARMSVQDLRTRINAVKGQTGYMGQKRKELVDKYGYDVKNAAHLIRLLNMAVEFLLQGYMYVDRTLIDAGYLTQIKQGAYSLETIERWANNMFDAAAIAYKDSELPEEPDWDAANKVCKRILHAHLLGEE